MISRTLNWYPSRFRPDEYERESEREGAWNQHASVDVLVQLRVRSDVARTANRLNSTQSVHMGGNVFVEGFLKPESSAPAQSGEKVHGTEKNKCQLIHQCKAASDNVLEPGICKSWEGEV